jgi:hypothetical protein
MNARSSDMNVSDTGIVGRDCFGDGRVPARHRGYLQRPAERLLEKETARSGSDTRRQSSSFFRRLS